LSISPLDFSKDADDDDDDDEEEDEEKVFEVLFILLIYD
jgi:hypothetical protein